MSFLWTLLSILLGLLSVVCLIGLGFGAWKLYQWMSAKQVTLPKLKSPGAIFVALAAIAILVFVFLPSVFPEAYHNLIENKGALVALVILLAAASFLLNAKGMRWLGWLSIVACILTFAGVGLGWFGGERSGGKVPQGSSLLASETLVVSNLLVEIGSVDDAKAIIFSSDAKTYDLNHRRAAMDYLDATGLYENRSFRKRFPRNNQWGTASFRGLDGNFFAEIDNHAYEYEIDKAAGLIRFRIKPGTKVPKRTYLYFHLWDEKT